MRNEPAATQYPDGETSNTGFCRNDARNFIEFCVELNNQDDRLVHPNDPELRPAIDAASWNPIPIFDSRRAVAEDVAAFRMKAPDAQLAHWDKLFRSIIDRGHFQRGQTIAVDDIFKRPDLNGFGPWQNAWLLYEGRGAYAGTYAIAIRGTVFSNRPSVTEDVIFQPVKAKAFLSKAVQFADNENAVLHSGLAHATFTTLLDDRYGILRILNDRKVPPASQIYVVGHSQGAAMATMTHAFLHYAQRDDDRSDNPTFGLKGTRYRLKSYAFAQPKPGNYAFSADFARIAQQADSALVINNDIDPVPKVPLTLQATSDLDDSFGGSSIAVRFIHAVSGLGATLRGAISAVVEPFVRKSAEGYGYFYRYENIRPLGADTTGASWDFSPAGHVIMVFGHPTNTDDLFFQHHAPTYRKLIAEQLGA